MFTGCCCAGGEESNQLTFHSTMDEGVAVGGHDQVPLHIEPAQAPAPAKPAEGSTGRSLSSEEKEQEKARLQQLVNSFAKKAVKGCPCTYIKEGTGERCPTKYSIDKTLEYLMVMSPEDPSKAEVTCPISAIQDIYSLVEDGEAAFPPEVLQNVKRAEMELLLLVVYRSGADKYFRFVLLEESRESRDVFLECIRILCIYAQSAPLTPA